jgi:hypothetical protein
MQVQELMFRKRPDVVDADLADYFGSIPHADLMKSLARRIGFLCPCHFLYQELRPSKNYLRERALWAQSHMSLS